MTIKLEDQVRKIFEIGSVEKQIAGPQAYTLAFNPDITVSINFSGQEDLILSFFKEDVLSYVNAVKALDPEDTSGNSLRLLRNLSDQMLLKANLVELAVKNKLAIKQLKSWFVFIVSELTFQSDLMRRATTKPRGYPGDYFLLESLYENRSTSEGGFGKLFDQYFQTDPLGIAVRNRKDYMAKFMKNLAVNSKQDLSILNLASGSCRDVVEAFSDLTSQHKVKISCLDQDLEAIEFGTSVLSKIGGYFEFDFINEDLFKFIRRSSSETKFDLVYSIGLADYLPDAALSELIEFGYKQLTKGGSFVLAHKDYTHYLPLPENWFCNWHFFNRNLEDIKKISRAVINNCEPRIERDPSGIMFYLIFEK